MVIMLSKISMSKNIEENVNATHLVTLVENLFVQLRADLEAGENILTQVKFSNLLQASNLIRPMIDLHYKKDDIELLKEYLK